MGWVVVQGEGRGLVFLQKVVQLSNEFHCYISQTSANVNILSETSAPPSGSSSMHHDSATTLNISLTSLLDLLLLQLIDLTEHIRLLLFIILLTVTKRQLIVILVATNLFILGCLRIPRMPILHTHFSFLILRPFLTEDSGIPSV